MLAIVTQPDGSARRFPFVTWILLSAMALVLSQQWDEMRTARSEALALHESALAYFHKNPFVAVQPDFAAQAGPELIDGVRAEFYSSRERLGIAPVPDRIQARSQKRFDGLAQAARDRFAQIPAQRFGLSAASGAFDNLFSHAFVHGSLGAFLLTALVLLLVGTVLEDVWGGVVFAGFVGAATAVTGVAAMQLGPGVWFGSCGIAGALVGAALIRQFSVGSPRLLGAVPLPGWLLIGLWLVAELGLVKWFGPGTLLVHSPVPHVAALAVGVALGLAVRMAGLEEVLASRWDDGESVNPVYDKAMELREKGKLEEAQRILVAEHAKKPRDRDIAMGLWDVCRDLGEPEKAAPMALMLIEEHLRAGATAAAVKQWVEVSDQVPGPQLKAPGRLAVRMADALFTEDQADRAIEALRVAVASDPPMPAAMASKVARQAHPIDADLAAKAAAIAFADLTLDASDRASLVGLVGEPEPEPSERPARPSEALSEFESDDEPDALAAASERQRDTSSGTASAERHAPAEALERWSLDADEIDPDALDPNALDLSGAEEEAEAEVGTNAAADAFFNFDSEALDPNALDLDDQDLADDAGDRDDVDVPLPVDDLPIPIDDLPISIDGLPESIDDPREGESDCDEMHDPRALALSDLEAEAVPGGLKEQGAIERSLATETTQVPDSTAVTPGDDPSAIWPASESEVETTPDLDPIASDEAAPAYQPQAPIEAPTTPLIVDSSAVRTVTQVTATPIELGPQGLTIVVADGRKLNIDWNRVDAIAVAAVGDLGAKPVLLIDLALNWSEAGAESLRLIRMRSDRFDPRGLTGVDDPVKALRALSLLLADASGGVPLPDANAVAGKPFAMFDTLAGYEREVLLGVRS